MSEKDINYQAPVYFNAIRDSFNRDMGSCADGEYVPRPKSLKRYQTLRREFVEDMRIKNRQARERLALESGELVSEYGIRESEARDLVLTAWDTESRLESEGAVFGDKAFNFSISRLEITPEEQVSIKQVAEEAVQSLSILARNGNPPNINLNSVERQFEDLNMIPNAARLDIVLTADGPKIIEINSQWVDAIGALAGFQKVYGEQAGASKLIKTFANCFEPNSELAIVDIPQVRGSRATGATCELEQLAKQLNATGRLRRCEVVNPEVTRIEYLEKFRSFYINCDPKYFALNEPDWTRVIVGKIRRDPFAMFPAWRPTFDKKAVLPILAQQQPSIVQSLPLSRMSDIAGDVFVKGDGYSLNNVFSSLDPSFQSRLAYIDDPDSYICQPALEGKRMPAWVYDTSASKVRFIPNAYSKLNVWVLKGKAVGSLVTLSDSPYISDKGYNALPIVKKGSNE